MRKQKDNSKQTAEREQHETTPGLNITQIKPQSNLGINVLLNSPREIWLHKTIRERVRSALKNLIKR